MPLMYGGGTVRFFENGYCIIETALSELARSTKGERITLGQLRIHSAQHLPDSKLIIAFTGWMDGGNVSTGTVDWLVETLHAPKVAEIDPEGFYIYNFPGTMGISALFRPHTHLEDGLIKTFDMPKNYFYCDAEQQVFLFTGKEPNVNWVQFADLIFEFASQMGISTICFIGSFGGLVPHTREPSLTMMVSDEKLKWGMEQFGIEGGDYEGPASFSIYLTTQAAARGVHMMSLVAEIPAYIQGTNPKCIEAVVRKLAAVMRISVDFERLRSVTDSWEVRLNEALESKPELVEYIGKLEERYDNEFFNSQMGDLREFLEQHGIQVD